MILGASHPIECFANSVMDPKEEDYFFNVESLKKSGHWAMFHEIGHHMQRDWWSK